MRGHDEGGGVGTCVLWGRRSNKRLPATVSVWPHI